MSLWERPHSKLIFSHRTPWRGLLHHVFWLARKIRIMLAYVFWHSATAGTSSQEYRQRLHAFHRQLKETPPTGFLASHTWHIGTVPWLEGAAYEDWYLVRRASDLDALAEGAVSRHVRSVHGAIAGLATSGIAGLYKPAQGAHAQADGTTVTWFYKPTGMPYDDLYVYLNERDPSIAGRLWQRFLTLGPTPEFCLAGNAGIDLPVEFAPFTVSRHR